MFVKLPIAQTHNGSTHISECQIEYDRTIAYPGEDPCSITFHHCELGEYQFNGRDIFECFCELRKALEEKNYKVLCSGARYDAYPSGASRNMSGGYKLHIYRMGEYPQRSDLVKIFDHADISVVATLQEQIDYHNEWVRSVVPDSDRG